MALGKQNVTVPVNSQLDTKTDSFLTEAANALVQENVRFYQTGALVKRPGFAQLESTITDPDPLNLTAKRVLSDNNQLYALGGTGPENAQTWIDGWVTFDGNEKLESNVVPGQIKLLDTFGGDRRVETTWLDYHDGKYALVISEVNESGEESGISSPSAFVFDGDQAIKLSPAKDVMLGVGDAYYSHRCCIIDDAIFGNLFVLVGIYDSASGAPQIRVTAYDMSLSQRLYVDLQTVVGAIGDIGFDHDSLRGQFTISIATGANTIRCFRYTRDGLGSLTLAANSTITTVNAINRVLDFNFRSSCILAYSVSDRPVIIQIQPGTLAKQFEFIDNAVPFIALSYAGSIWADNAGRPIVAWSYTSGRTTELSIRRIDPAVGTATQLGQERGVRLLGRGYSDAAKNILPVISYLTGLSAPGQIGVFSVLQIGVNPAARNNTSYICNALIERIIYPLDFKISSFPRISSTFPALSGLMFGVAPQEPSRTIVFENGTANPTALDAKADILQFDYNQTDLQYGTELNLGDSLMIFGGSPSIIDPGGLNRLSLPLEPFFTADIIPGPAGAFPIGNYTVNIHFEKTDERGNTIFSPIGTPVTLNVTSTSSNLRLEIRFSRQLAGSVVSIYCTQTNGNILQLVERVSCNQDLATIVWPISAPPDANAPIIYTAGGVLESTGCPPASHACSHNDRVFIVPADERNKVYYSNKYIQGEVPSFNTALFIETANSTPRYRDKITATQGIGDKLIIFRENSIYWVAGDGANLLGVNQSFTSPEVLAQDIGCTNSRSVILTPSGIMFKSDKGIYLIDGGLSLSYVGAPVETYNAESIIDTCLITQRNIVLMLTANRILCFDYLQQRWSVDTVSGLASLAIWQNKIVALKASGRLSVESTAFVDDFGEMTPPSISMKLVTGWMKLSGLQDYARIWRLLILGRWKSSHTLTVKVYYDYDDTTVETYTISQTTSLNLYQFNIHLRRQKCESIKVELFDTGSGQSLDITGMTLEVGVKQGTMKVPAARKL